MSLVTIPNEILREILMELNLPDILKICSTNRQISLICNSDAFWKSKLEKDYPLAKNTKNTPYRGIPLRAKNIRYKNLYIHVYQTYKSYIEPIFNKYSSQEYTFSILNTYYLTKIKLPLEVLKEIKIGPFYPTTTYTIIPDIIIFTFIYADSSIKYLHPEIDSSGTIYMILYRPLGKFLPMHKQSEDYRTTLSRLALKWKYELIHRDEIKSRVNKILNSGYIISSDLIEIDYKDYLINELAEYGLINIFNI
jgi:hypothetical protein